MIFKKGGIYINTNIRVIFSIYGEEISLDYITNKLNIKPNFFYKKGDKIKNNSLYKRMEDYWSINTGDQVSLDINEQLNQILEQIQDKESELLEIKKLYNPDFKFDVVIIIENNELPAVYLEKKIINFASKIGAEIDFDMYIN